MIWLYRIVSFRGRRGRTVVVAAMAFFLIFVMSFAAIAKDYDYGCKFRNPRYKPTMEELEDYIKDMEIIFEGKPKSRDPFVMGFISTKFDVGKIIKGERPEKGIVEVIHTDDMFTDVEGTYFVRARRGKDNYLYPEGMSCPKYYSDQEIVDFYRYYWFNFAIGLLILLVGVTVTFFFLRSDNEFSRKLKWLRR